MGGLPYDCVMNPIGAVRSTFREAFSSVADPSSIGDRDWGVRDLFNHFLLHQNGLSQVPILDHKTVGLIQSNTLVRFRGMIQDMLGNEIYVGAYKDGMVWRTNKFFDLAEIPLDEDMPRSCWQRLLFNCVPVPGLNSWAELSSEATMKKRMDEASPHREKRLRSDDEDGDHMMDLEVSVNQVDGSPSAKKMRHPSDSTQPSSNGLPNISEDSLSCIVKLYDVPESDFKLNEVYEFIGIFISDPENQHEYDTFEDFMMDQDKELCLPRLPPRIKVPHLHCIIPRKLGLVDFLPTRSVLEPKLDIIMGMREALLRHLTEVLGGDRLAADFMLLHLLSRVHHRTHSYPVGKFSLNLTGFTKETGAVFRNQLRLAIKNLLPFSNYLPITVQSLNAASFSPKKHEETNILATGPLQVADGTHIILDETEYEDGAHNSIGCDNVESLKAVVESQMVFYDCKIYKLPIMADIQFLTLSKSKPEICPADLVLPLRPSSRGLCEASPAELAGWRWYFAEMRSLPYTIEDQLQLVIQTDLAQMKQVHNDLGAEDFHRLLTMARLICLSYGETSLTSARWSLVLNLESQRRQRL